MMVPSTRLILVAAALLVPAGVLCSIPGFTGLGVLLALLVLTVAVLDALWSRHLLDNVSLESPTVVRFVRGRRGSFELGVRSQALVRRKLRLGLLSPPEAGILDEDLLIPVGAGAAAASISCQPSERGNYPIAACAAETASRIGLWLVRKRLPLRLELRVYPDLTAARDAAAFLRRGQTGTHAQRQIGRGKEFEKLRDYAPGDGFDEVDWKATARRGRPITRVFQMERTQEVYVVLDASRLSARRIESGAADTILERNVTAALLLALECEKQGDLFGLVTFSDRVHSFIRARNGKAHFGDCREALYTLHPRIVTPDFDEVGALLRLRLRRRALILFLTELDDPAVAESFVKTVEVVCRRHVVIVGMMQPPAARPLFEGRQPDEADQIYSRLAGHMEWRNLRSVAQSLQRRGIHFSLVQPDSVASDLAAAYTRVKRQQIL